tara:strand:+ start:98 stop:331 length:234 start_codon:yes stop_codon:yes gene_type:complete
MIELKEKDKTLVSLDVRFEEDGSIKIRARDRITQGDTTTTFVMYPNASAHNAVMKMLTDFARKLANKKGIPVRFQDV